MEEQESKSKDIDHKESDSLTGIIILAVGIIFLLNNFGMLSWSVWSILWKFWPVILIIWGFEKIFEGTFLRFFSILIGLVILAFVFTYSLVNTSPQFRNWVNTNFPEWQRYENYFNSIFNKDYYQKYKYDGFYSGNTFKI